MWHELGNKHGDVDEKRRGSIELIFWWVHNPARAPAAMPLPDDEDPLKAHDGHPADAPPNELKASALFFFPLSRLSSPPDGQRRPCCVAVGAPVSTLCASSSSALPR